MEENRKIRKTLIDFYASYIRQIQLNPQIESDLNMKNILQITLSNPSMNFQIDFQIVTAIMELLCDEFIGKAFEESDSNCEYLMNIWFSNSQRQMKAVKVEDHNSTVDILLHNLKMKMFSANDERIVKVIILFLPLYKYFR